jgi:hypothetical protein
MKKTTCETTDIVSFEPHEWKQISSEPVVYEALNDETVLKFRNYEKNDEEEMQSHSRYVFNKGESVEVSISDTKFKLSFDNREFRNGESIDFDLQV